MKERISECEKGFPELPEHWIPESLEDELNRLRNRMYITLKDALNEGNLQLASNADIYTSFTFYQLMEALDLDEETVDTRLGRGMARCAIPTSKNGYSGTWISDHPRGYHFCPQLTILERALGLPECTLKSSITDGHGRTVLAKTDPPSITEFLKKVEAERNGIIFIDTVTPKDDRESDCYVYHGFEL